MDGRQKQKGRRNADMAASRDSTNYKSVVVLSQAPGVRSKFKSNSLAAGVRSKPDPITAQTSKNQTELSPNDSLLAHERDRKLDSFLSSAADSPTIGSGLRGDEDEDEEVLSLTVRTPAPAENAPKPLGPLRVHV